MNPVNTNVNKAIIVLVDSSIIIGEIFIHFDNLLKKLFEFSLSLLLLSLLTLLSLLLLLLLLLLSGLLLMYKDEDAGKEKAVKEDEVEVSNFFLFLNDGIMLTLLFSSVIVLLLIVVSITSS